MDESNVVREPVERVVRMAQRLLDDALAGQLRGLAIVGLQAEYGDRSVSTGWQVEVDRDDIWALLGGAVHLAARVERRIEDPERGSWIHDGTRTS